MVATAVTIVGGAAHGMAALSPAEHMAAQNALAKLTNPASGLGSSLGGVRQSATVFSGSSQSQAPTLLRGQGSDTFLGGAASGKVFPSVGTDTVVSGSASFAGGTSLEPAGAGQHFSLSSSDTINVAGATAAGVQGLQAEDSAKTTHTITLADKTTITIAGLSTHDISKLTH